jgi:hypothetical protein
MGDSCWSGSQLWNLAELFAVFIHQQTGDCDAINTVSVSEYVNTKNMCTCALLFQLHVIEIVLYVSCQYRLAHRQ